MTAFVARQRIEGVSFFDGHIDGKEIKSGTVFISEKLDDSRGNAKGFRTVAYPAQESGVIRSVMHNEFPLDAEVGMETRVTKGKSELVVSTIKPMGRPVTYQSPEAKAQGIKAGAAA